MSEEQKGRKTGHSVPSIAAGSTVQAFVPYPLPPQPPLNIEQIGLERIERANRSLGRIDGLTTILPDTSLFLFFYVRKEAILSSQIEGTQSSLEQLLLFESQELTSLPIDEIQEVSNYVRALYHGLEQIRGQGLPLSLRLIRDIHRILLAGTRGQNKDPGQFRRVQNWVGGGHPSLAAFIPPPPLESVAGMQQLESFLHDRPERTPPLIKAGLMHVQLETLHPFLDGNGRLGRLLIPLLLCSEKVLDEPTLYLSLYFKTHRQAYYQHLQRVRTEGDWEGWLGFFLDGVADTADKAVEAAKSILTLFESDRESIRSLGGTASSALRLHDHIQKKPIASVANAATQTGLSVPTVGSAFHRLQKLGIVHEMTGKKRGRLFAYASLLAILNEGI